MNKEQLKKFADETVDLEVKTKFSFAPEIGELIVEVHDILEEASFEIGEKGEQFVVKKLEEKGYVAVRTKGSRSDSDIFAYKQMEDSLCHLMLVQVKSTKEKDKPKTLSPEEIEGLKTFNGFVVRQWLESDLIPEEVKKSKVIFSCGYAGVLTFEKPHKMYQPQAYQFYYPKSLKSQLEKFRNIVKDSHKF